MGMDLFMVTPEPDEAARVDAAWAAVKEAEKAKAPSAELDAAWLAFYAARRSYHRFSWQGMYEAVCRMDILGMLTDEDPPPWPDAAAFGVDEDNPDSACGECREEYDQEFRKVVTYGGCEGIPAAKFATNDGWVVRPDQITAALTAYGKYPGQSRALITGGDPHWEEWLDFLMRARDRDGFRVY